VNPFRGLLKNWSEEHRLEPRYYRLTSLVGFLGGMLGLGLLIFTARRASTVIGISWDAPLRSQPNGLLWLIVLLLGIPLAIYAGAVLVAGVVALVMVCLGKFTAREAWQYALMSRYPTYWFKK
jgi:hypothetical protein